MNIENTELLHTDVLIIGGGTAGCYAALTVRENSDYKIIIAEKANIKRSGCLAAGVNAINAYIVKGRKPEEYLVFEDAGYAIETAKNAGFITVGIRDMSNGDDWQQIRETAD